MISNERREKLLVGLTFGIYLLGWLLVGSWPELAAIAFLGILIPAYMTVPRDRPNRVSTLKQTMSFVAVLCAGGLWMSVVKCGDLDESRRFRTYLSQHQCKPTGELVTGFAAGRCGRFEECSDGQEIAEEGYLCRATGMTITFSQFRRGHYGF